MADSQTVIRCDKCGRYYHLEDVWYCRETKEVLCPECRRAYEEARQYRYNEDDYFEDLEPVTCRQPERRRFPTWAKTTIAVALAICVIVVAFAVFTDFSPNPHIVPDNDHKGNLTTYQSVYTGNNSHVTLVTPVEASVYYGAQSTRSHKIDDNEEDYLTYWARMTTDPQQDTMYQSLCSKFQEIQRSKGFDSNRFVEMVTEYVQGLTYDDTASDFPRYPVETLVDGKGDCDEKSMLLAGILAEAGYDVVLFNFDSRNGDAGHMTVGIRTDDSTAYRGGYSIIETTSEYYYVTENSIDSSLVYVGMMKIGEGTMKYTAGKEAQAIITYLESLNYYFDALDSQIDRKYDQENQYVEKLNSLQNEADILGQMYLDGIIDYSTYLLEFDRLDSAYTAYRSELYEIEDNLEYSTNTYNKWVEIYNTVVEAHISDRAETYRYIQRNPL